MNKKILFFLIFISPIVLSSERIKGYKDNFYHLYATTSDVCELNSKYTKNWCVPVQRDAIGLYVGFNQVVVYSKQIIQGIDTVRRQAKWSIAMKNAFKIHINYPVIVIFYQDKRIVGYDYFTGFQLWEKQNTTYNNMFETETNLWLVKGKTLDKLDVVSGEVIHPVKLKAVPKKLVGNEVYLYYQSANQLFHHNIYSKNGLQVGKNNKIIDQSSTLCFN